MLVAALQMGPAAPTISETAERIIKLVDKAGEAGVKLAVLPELALTPYFAAKIQEDLTPFVSPEANQAAIEAIADRSAQYGMALVLPFAEQNNVGLYNSMAFIDDQGERVGTFRKMHIPGQVEPKPDTPITILEKRYFLPGDLGFSVHDVGAAKVGGLICYDRRFPESYRSLSTNGAEIIAASFNTPVMPGGTLAAARNASKLSMTAGAYYTGTTVIAAGKAGREGGVTFIGRSCVIGPDGTILAVAKTQGDEIVIAEVDVENQAKIRERWSFATNRRPDDYVMREPA
jgi:predicted amidohydrolase